MDTNITSQTFIAMPPEAAAQHLQSHSKEVLKDLASEAKSGKLSLNDAFKVIKILNTVDDTKAKEINQEYDSAIKELIQSFDKGVKDFHDTFKATPMMSINKKTHQYQKSWFAGRAYEVADLLTDAIKKGHFAIVENIFANYNQIDHTINNKGETYLEVAVAHDYSPMVQKYLKSHKEEYTHYLSEPTRQLSSGEEVKRTRPPRLYLTNDDKNILHLIAKGKSPNCTAEVQKALNEDLQKVLERALHQPDVEGNTPLDILFKNPGKENEKTARLFLELAWNSGDKQTVQQLVEAFGKSIVIDLLQSEQEDGYITYLGASLVDEKNEEFNFINTLISPDDLLSLLQNPEHIIGLSRMLRFESNNDAPNAYTEKFTLLQDTLGSERFKTLMQSEMSSCNALILCLSECSSRIIEQIRNFLGEEVCKALVYERTENRSFKSIVSYTNMVLSASNIEDLLYNKLATLFGSKHSEFLKELCQPDTLFIPALLKNDFFSTLSNLQEKIPEFNDLLNAVDRNGNHALHHYATSSKFTIDNVTEFIDTNLEALTAFYLTGMQQSQETPTNPLYLKILENLLSAKNKQGETPLERAIHAGNTTLLDDLMYFAQSNGYTDMPALIDKSVNVLNPYILQLLSRLQILLTAESLEKIPKVSKRTNELLTYLVKEHSQLPFALALQTEGSRAIFEAQSDEYRKLCFDQYPSLQQFNNSYIRTVAQLRRNLEAQPRAQLLEIGLFMGHPALFLQITKFLTPEEYQEQKMDLEKRFPELKETLDDRIDSLRFAVDERHMHVDELAKLEIDKSLLAPFNYEEIYSGFKQVNFSDRTKPGYRDPNTLKNDVGTTYVPITVKELDDALNKLIHTFIPNNQGYEGTPPSGTPELKQFYSNLKEQYQEVLYHMDQLKRLKEIDPNASEADLRDAADAISRGCLAIAISAKHCGSRWQQEVEDTIRDLKGTPESLDEMLGALMGTLRSSIAETIANLKDTESHTKGTVFSQLAKRMAIPGASRIIEHLDNRTVIEQETINEFNNKYTPSAMYKHLLQKMEEKPKVKAAVLDWFKDNPGTWHKEEYADKLAVIQNDPAWQQLIKQIHDQPMTNNPLSRAFRDINIPENLAEILAEIDYEASQKPEDYPALVVTLFTKTHSHLDQNRLRTCCSLLSTDPSLQTAFHEWIFSQLPDYKSNEMQTTVKLLAELDKVEKGSKVMAFLKEKKVPVDRQMAEKMAVQSNYNEILADMLERQRGEEFAKDVYFSPGSEFIDMFADLAAEDYEILETLRAADTPDKFISFLRNQWSALFEDRHPQALEVLLQKAGSDKDFAAICKTCLLNPDSKNQKHLKELLLELPNMNYQFQRPQLMRLLQAKGFIRALS